MATLLCPGGCIAALVRLLTGWGWDGLDIGALRYLEYWRCLHGNKHVLGLN